MHGDEEYLFLDGERDQTLRVEVFNQGRLMVWVRLFDDTVSGLTLEQSIVLRDRLNGAIRALESSADGRGGIR